MDSSWKPLSITTGFIDKKICTVQRFICKDLKFVILKVDGQTYGTDLCIIWPDGDYIYDNRGVFSTYLIVNNDQYIRFIAVSGIRIGRFYELNSLQTFIVHKRATDLNINDLPDPLEITLAYKVNNKGVILWFYYPLNKPNKAVKWHSIPGIETIVPELEYAF